MTPKKLWETIEHYNWQLIRQGHKAKQFSPAEYDSKVVGREAIIDHCLWMTRHCLDVFRPEHEAAYRSVLALAISSQPIVAAVEAAFEPLGKAMRWMAYVQGVCNALGVYSCNELRDHSRADKPKTVGTQMLHPPRPLAEGELSIRAAFPPRPPVSYVEQELPEFRSPPTAMSMDHLNRPPELIRHRVLTPAEPPMHPNAQRPTEDFPPSAERTVECSPEQMDYFQKRLAEAGRVSSADPTPNNLSKQVPPVPHLTDEQLDRARLDQPPRPTEDTCSDDGTPK